MEMVSWFDAVKILQLLKLVHSQLFMCTIKWVMTLHSIKMHPSFSWDNVQLEYNTFGN